MCCTYSYCYGGNMNHDVFPTDAVGMYIISYHAVCCIYSYCCCGNHAVTCSITQILLRNVNKFHFVPLLTLLVFVCSSETGDLDVDKRSISDRASITRGLQNWTLCTTKRLPTRHRRRPRLHRFLFPGVLCRLRLRLLAPFAA